jgi:hypothetical protein
VNTGEFSASMIEGLLSNLFIQQLTSTIGTICIWSIVLKFEHLILALTLLHISSLFSSNTVSQIVNMVVSEGDISDEPEDRISDMSQLYQIFADEVLGSGQFGIVYGGQ